MQPCNVVCTDFRPVPLQHYIFPAGGSGLHLVLDADGVFKVKQGEYKPILRDSSSGEGDDLI